MESTQIYDTLNTSLIPVLSKIALGYLYVEKTLVSNMLWKLKVHYAFGRDAYGFTHIYHKKEDAIQRIKDDFIKDYREVNVDDDGEPEEMEESERLKLFAEIDAAFSKSSYYDKYSDGINATEHYNIQQYHISELID